MRWLDELQRMATDAETALLARSQRQLADSRHRLPELDLPTLVLHSRNDQMNGFEHSRYLAAHLRGARLVALESENHIVLADEPAWPVLLRELTDFLADGPAARHRSCRCRPRRRALRAGAGRPHPRGPGTRQHRDRRRAVLSVRTVERHLQNAYGKLGLQGRTARTAAVARLLARS